MFFNVHSHNEDGSYTYGFEGSDGSFKIETKAVTGEVSGKYGYVDDSGKLRVVEYGANKHGFQPSGEGITVPPPTLVELARHEDEADQEQDEGLQRPVKRPVQSVKVPKASYAPQRAGNDGGFVQQSAAARTVDFGDQTTFDVPSRPDNPRVFGSSYRPTSSRQNFPQPPVSGSFRAAPERDDGPPTGSYSSVQQFADGGAISPNIREIPSSAFGEIPSVTGPAPYQTFEDQEPLTQPPAPYQARRKASSAAARTASAVNYRTESRQMRTSSVLDQLAEQYALPKSSASRETHNYSF